MDDLKEHCFGLLVWLVILVGSAFGVYRLYSWGTTSSGITSYTGRVEAIDVGQYGYRACIVTDNGFFWVNLTVAQRNAIHNGEIITVDYEYNNFGVQIGTASINSGTHPNPEKN